MAPDLNNVEDKQVVYPLVIFITCYCMLFLALFISPWFFVAMAIFAVISSLLAYNDYVNIMKLATSLPRLLIVFNTDDENEEIVEENEDETVHVYGVKNKPELMRINEPDLIEALRNRLVEEEFKRLKEEIKRFYNPRLEYIKAKNGQVGARIIDIRKQHVNFFRYDIEFFLEVKLESFLEKDEIKFLKEKGIDDVKKYIELEKKTLQELGKEMQNTLDKGTDLVKIRSYLAYNVENFINMKTYKFLINRGINNLGVWLEQDLERLQKEYTKKFGISADIKDIGKHALDMRDEVRDKLATLLFELDDNDKLDMVRLQEVPLFMIHFDNYFYRLNFDKEFTITVNMEGEEDKEIVKNECICVFPKPYEDSVNYMPRTIDFCGFPVKVPQTEKLELVYKMMVLGVPIFYCNSCSYSRRRIKDKVQVDNDKFLMGVIISLVKEIQEIQTEKSKIVWQYEDDKNKIQSLTHMVKYTDAKKLENEDVDKSFEKKKKEIQWKMSPPKQEVKIYWVFLILILIVGIFIGWGLFSMFGPLLEGLIENLTNVEIAGA